MGITYEELEANVAAGRAAQAAEDRAQFQIEAKGVQDQAIQAAQDYVNSARGEITEHANAVNAVQRDLENNLSGFLTGAIAPMYKTTDANVNIRDANFGQVATPVITAETAETGLGIGTILIGAALAYFIFFRRKK